MLEYGFCLCKGLAMPKTGLPKIVKFPTLKQRRMDLLLDKNSEGTITRKEKAELEALVSDAEQLMVENARRIENFSRRESSGPPPPGAMPVTVWVQPNPSGR
jgi:hypothetical protein